MKRRGIRSPGSTAPESPIDPPIDQEDRPQVPIDAPAGMQPQSVLIVLAQTDLSITHASANLGDLCGLAANEASGVPIASVVGAENADRLAAITRSGASIDRSPLRMEIAVAGVVREFECIVRREQQAMIVEFLPLPAPLDVGALDAAHQRRDTEALRQIAAALQRSNEALRRSERALRKSESFLDRTGAVAGVGGWDLDLLTGEVYWSDQTCRIHGVKPGFRPTFDEAVAFYAPEAIPIIKNAVERGINHGEDWDLELPFIRADGSRLWVRSVGTAEFADGRAVRLVGAFQDITERVAARLALEEMNERILLATRSGGIGIYEWDLTNGEITWDDTLRRLYAMEASQATPSVEEWHRLVHPEDLPRLEAMTKRAIANREALDIEHRIRWPNGSIHYLRVAGHVTYDQNGRPLRLVGANWDVTEQRQLTNAIENQHQLMRVTMQSIGDGVITTDADGKVTWLNPVAEAMTGWSTQEAKDQPIATVFNIINEATRAPVDSPVTACLKHGMLVGLANHTTLVSRSGGEAAIADSAAQIRNDRGEILGAVLVFHDVSEQRRLSGEASHRAAHDTLTGLPNRAQLTELLDGAISAASQHGTILAVLFIDLNKFKAINDTFGHATGDRILQAAANRMKACVRSDDFVARLGGDEFVIVLPKLLDERDSEVIAQKLIAAIAEPIDLRALPELRIGVSIGIAQYPTDGLDADTILRHADLAMYRSKKLGRSGFTRFGVVEPQARDNLSALPRRILRGLERGEFVPYYQPIVDLRSGRLAGIEALARWNHPRLGVLAPSQFMAIAEDSGSIFRLGDVMLRSAISDTARWRAASCPDLRVSVNVSPRQFSDDRFMFTIHDIFSDTGAAPDSLQIELTENALFENNERALRTLSELRDLGIRIAIDDFGTGYSSLSRLQRLPVHTLKIDKSFVREISRPDSGRAIVRAIIAMAHSLDLSVVAEGVETALQLDVLRDEGCDAIQGYLTGEPLNNVDATLFISRATNAQAGSGRRTIFKWDAEPS